MLTFPLGAPVGHTPGDVAWFQCPSLFRASVFTVAIFILPSSCSANCWGLRLPWTDSIRPATCHCLLGKTDSLKPIPELSQLVWGHIPGSSHVAPGATAHLEWPWAMRRALQAMTPKKWLLCLCCTYHEGSSLIHSKNIPIWPLLHARHVM